MLMSPKQLAAAQLLASGMSARQASLSLGIHETTLARWKKLPEFRLHIRDLIQQAEHDSIDMLHSLKKRAVERLGELLNSNNAQVSLKAAEAILDRTNSPYVAKPEHDLLDDALAELYKTF